MKRPSSQDRRRSPAPSAAGPPRPAAPRRRRVWWFRLVLLLGVPLFLLGGLEAVLRLGDYGHPTTFFRRAVIGETPCWVENDRFGLQFFPPELSRSPPPVVMEAVKPPGLRRIFLLGESAALGDPRPAYGVGRYLQALLRERHPAADFEVVCVAMTAINSHALLRIARECARHEGDLWIVYLGNNEMVGPFGAASVFGPAAPPWRWVRWRLAVQQTRTGQWLSALGHRLRARSAPPGGWTGMQLFLQSQISPDDPLRQAVHHNFQQNLEDILTAGQDAGVKILLSTMAVNLKDCPPFASLPGSSVAAAATQECQRLLAVGTQAEAEGRTADAAELYQRALALDPDFAELRFRLGQCLARLGRPAEARRHFEAARDGDALPFRADARINSLIAGAASRRSGDAVRFVDADLVLSARSPERIPGEEVFYEHVHLNFTGNYALARAFADALAPWLPAAATRDTRPAWASQEVCEQRLGLTDWNRASVIEDVMRRLKEPPFSTQANSARRLEALRTEWQNLRRGLTAAAATEARQVYETALRQSPGDHRLHENYAEFLEDTGELAGAAVQWQAVAQLTAHHHLGHFQHGRLLARQGRFADAESPLREALARRPDLSEGWFELGKVHLALDQPTVALQDLQHARRLLPQDWRAPYQMGRAFSQLNRRAEAIASLREALRLKADYVEARYLLGEELAFDGHNEEARAEFEAVLRLHPNHLAARLNLGVALVEQNQLKEAAAQFREVLRLDPDNARATNYLGQVEARLKTLNRP